MTAKKNTDANPERVAVDAKKNGELSQEKIIKLSSGYKVRVTSVSATLIDAVTARIKDPAVPEFYNEQKGRYEPNPADPAYEKGLQEADRRRAMAALDAILVFAIEIVEAPEGEDDSKWLKQLRILEKTGALDLSAFDTNDEDDLDFLRKKYVAVKAEDMEKIMEVASVSDEMVEEETASFQSS